MFWFLWFVVMPGADTLVSHMAELTDEESLGYDTFIDYFGRTLVEARIIQRILNEAIAKKIRRNAPRP